MSAGQSNVIFSPEVLFQQIGLSLSMAESGTLQDLIGTNKS